MLSLVLLVYLLYDCHTSKLNLHFLYIFYLYVVHPMFNFVASRPIDDAIQLLFLPQTFSIGTIIHSYFYYCQIFNSNNPVEVGPEVQGNNNFLSIDKIEWSLTCRSFIC